MTAIKKMIKARQLDEAILDNLDEAYDQKGPDRKFVAVIGRAFDILRAFRPGGGPLGNSELSAATGLPKATVTRLTHTLTRLGYLNQLAGSGKYEPSPSILALGYCVMSNIRIRQLACANMQQLADHAGATVGLASRDRLSMIYVEQCHSVNIRTLHPEIGLRVPIATSALGRAFLAGISEPERHYFFGHFARILGDEWMRVRREIEDGIQQIAERGFCLVDGAYHQDARAVAVPLVSPDGNSVMAMTCAGPSFQLSVNDLEADLGPRLAHLCRSLTPLIGG
jgi:DNA-binding IclR family transcriptional regulator